LFVIVLNQYKRLVFTGKNPIKNEELILEIANQFLVRGNYLINTLIHSSRISQIDVAEDVYHFSVLDSGSEFSKHVN